MIQTKDLDLINRELRSVNYIMETRTILDLIDSINAWIENGECGGIVYGKPRIGKTWAMHYIKNQIAIEYGSDMPVYIHAAIPHNIISEKTFLSEMLRAVGHAEVYKGTALQMKDRLISTIISKAKDTELRKAILFIDEAQYLSPKEFAWLMGIYNTLCIYDIQLITVLFGSLELKSLKNSLCLTNQHQIVGRFMVEEYNFHGIISARDVCACLNYVDQEVQLGNIGTIILTKEFFPDAYKAGERLVRSTNIFWDAFKNIVKENKLKVDEMEMKFFINALVACLLNFGKYGKSHYFPDQNDWLESLNQCGYIKFRKGLDNVA